MGTKCRQGYMAVVVVVSIGLSWSMGVGGEGKAVTSLGGQFTAWTRNTVFWSDGRRVQLVLDKYFAAGMESKQTWLFGGFGAWIKLPANNSAGTVTTFYMSSLGPNHCEFDVEFLGNETGQPFLLHSNIFVNGVGGREQQIFLDFDPSAAFHYYNFQWNKDLVVFFVDHTPVRMFRNLEGEVPGFAYPNAQPMGVYLSIWDGSRWATQGGRVKLDWAVAPFVATFERFHLNGCVADAADPGAAARCGNTTWAAPGSDAQLLSTARIRQIRAVRANQVKYNYCDDRVRYPVAPPECAFIVL